MIVYTQEKKAWEWGKEYTFYASMMFEFFTNIILLSLKLNIKMIKYDCYFLFKIF